MQDSGSVLILRRTQRAHAAHHGAWKVAYADFVSALMALFITLWLLSSKDQTRQAVGGYFRDPSQPMKSLSTTVDGSGPRQISLDAVQQELSQILKQTPQLDAIKDYVKTSITGEGLRIEMVENEGGIFFITGHPEPTAFANEFLVALAKELGRLPNTIAVEGHTDSTPFKNDKGYTNWDLSTDRANAARRLLIANGVRPGQIARIAGFADQHLVLPDKPHDPSNRRVSIVVQYLN